MPEHGIQRSGSGDFLSEINVNSRHQMIPAVSQPVHKDTLYTLRSQIFPRFSITTLLLLTALIACIIAYILKSAELRKVRSDLLSLQREMLVLDASDQSKIYAMGFPTYGPLHWRWKVQLPAKGRFRLRYAIDQFADSGLSQASYTIDDAFLNSYRQPLPSGVPFTLDVGIYKNEHGSWMIRTRNGNCGWGELIPDPPSWLDGQTVVGWMTKYHEPGRTVFATSNSALPLLYHHRKGCSLNIWIEPVDEKPEDNQRAQRSP